MSLCWRGSFPTNLWKDCFIIVSVICDYLYLIKFIFLHVNVSINLFIYLHALTSSLVYVCWTRRFTCLSTQKLLDHKLHWLSGRGVGWSQSSSHSQYVFFCGTFFIFPWVIDAIQLTDSELHLCKKACTYTYVVLPERSYDCVLPRLT